MFGRFRALAARVLAASLLLGAPAFAQAPQPRVPASQAEVKLSFAPVVARTAQAVVNVYAQKTVKQRSNPLFDDPFFRRFFGGQGFGAPERMQRSLGSGVIVDPSGLVVTNYHVIEGADEVRIALNDRREFEAEVLLRDQRTDLAILRIRRDGREPLAFLSFGDSDALAVGDLVLAIGDPFGVGQTVTQGIVSALARTQVGISDYQFFIQTDAAINPGNSGGALVDMAGHLVGINSAIYSRTGTNLGIGFAIPANMVRVVVEQAQNGNKVVRRPWLGAGFQRVTPDIAEGLGLARPTGVLVQKVVPGSPAAKAGLKVGDLVVGIEGQNVDDPEGLYYRFATRAIGGKAALAVVRSGKEVGLVVVLEAAPESVPRDPLQLRTRSPFSGATVMNLSPAVAEELKVDSDDTGVVIYEVADDSPAAVAGLKPGDVVVEVNGEKIVRTRDLERVTRAPQRGWRVVVVRAGRTISANLPG